MNVQSKSSIWEWERQTRLVKSFGFHMEHKCGRPDVATLWILEGMFAGGWPRGKISRGQCHQRMVPVDLIEREGETKLSRKKAEDLHSWSRANLK